jgi:hypothetical protein
MIQFYACVWLRLPSQSLSVLAIDSGITEGPQRLGGLPPWVLLQCGSPADTSCGASWSCFAACAAMLISHTTPYSVSVLTVFGSKNRSDPCRRQAFLKEVRGVLVSVFPFGAVPPLYL